MECQNFENMVHYNSNKLRLVQKGWNATRVFSLAERKRLIRVGILLKFGAAHFELSRETSQILDDIE